MTSTPRKVLPAYITTTGNSNIRHYQAKAAAQVYSTARNVLPFWTTNYFLPEPQSSSSLSSSTIQNPSTVTPSSGTTADHSVRDRFVAFDVLRGRDVFVTATESAFTIYNVGDGGVELQELCGYVCDNKIICIKIVPCFDKEAPPKAAILTKSSDDEVTLSIALLSTSLTIESTLVLPNLSSPTIITSSHYIATPTLKHLLVYSHSLTPLTKIPLPSQIYAGSNRWLVYPTTRPNPSTNLTPILDTPPESRLYERMARGLTKEVVSWGRETGEKALESLSAYLSGQPTTPEKEKKSPPPTVARRGRQSTLVVYDIPAKRVMAQIMVPFNVGYISLAPSGMMLFCSTLKGDEFYVYSLESLPGAVHLVATFSRGYTYSSVADVCWRGDSNCLGVISQRGTGHIFSLKRRGKEIAKAVGKIKTDGGVKGIMFLKRLRQKPRRRSSTTKGDETPEILTVANTHERVVSWKLLPAQKSTIGLLTAYFNPPTTNTEPQSIPLSLPIAEYTLPTQHQPLSFPSLTSSPIIKAAFTNQKESLDCTAKAEVECSLSTHGITGIRGLRLFEYTLSSTDPPSSVNDFGTPLPWTFTKEIDLGMPRGEVRYIASSSTHSSTQDTPPSSEGDTNSPDHLPDKKKRGRKKQQPQMMNSDLERALGTELDKTNMVAVPPTPPGSVPTPKIPPAEWILDKGKDIVRNVRRRRSATVTGKGGDGNVDFEEGVEVLTLEDVPDMELGASESSEGSGEGKVRGEGSMLGVWD